MDIEIRHAEEDDCQAVQQIHAQPKAIWGTLQVPFPSLEMWKKRLAEKSGNRYHLVACVEGKVVGLLGLTIETYSPRRRHAGSLGMAVHDQWRGRGVGTALTAAAIDLADNWLNLVRIELTVFTDNESAVKLYQKFGFKIEGTLEGYAYRDGCYADAYCMARVRSSKD